MANRRKTVEVAWLRELVNARLEKSTCSPEVRRGMASVLESVLHETGNYRGFQYLPSANSRNEEVNGTWTWTCDDETRIAFI